MIADSRLAGRTLFPAPMLTAIVIFSLTAGIPFAQAADWRDLSPPVVEGTWLRPAAEGPSQPIWGHAGGLRIGLAPMPGPRGLLRVYAPGLDLPEGRVINFIAVEPIPLGDEQRALSELEPSRLDHRRGKRFWSVDDPGDSARKEPTQPARGQVDSVDGVETLTVWVLVERFENGTHVYLRLTFRDDRPDEVGIATFAHADSRPLSHCIVTATMGNFARLREVHLADRTVTAANLWPNYRQSGFTPHAHFSLAELARTAEGEALVTATPDEADPRSAVHAPGTSEHWRYRGRLATQSWRSERPPKGLEVLVNGRFTYWASRAPIPGGISFENFEMVAPFEQGREFWFGVREGVGSADAPRDDRQSAAKESE